MVVARVLVITIAVAAAAAASAAGRPNARDALQAAFARANKDRADNTDFRAALATVNALLAMPDFNKGPVVDRTDPQSNLQRGVASPQLRTSVIITNDLDEKRILLALNLGRCGEEAVQETQPTAAGS